VYEIGSVWLLDWLHRILSRVLSSLFLTVRVLFVPCILGGPSLYVPSRIAFSPETFLVPVRLTAPPLAD